MLAKSTLATAISIALLATTAHADEPKAAEPAKLDIQLKEVKKQPTLVIKKTVKQSEISATLHEIFPKIYGYAGQKGIQPSAPLAKFTTEGDKFQVEGGFVVPAGTKGEGDIVTSDLPAGKAAFAIHVGPYEKLPDTYKALSAWLNAKGLNPSNIGWEIYGSPDQAKPEEMKTEVYLLVEPEKKSK